MPDADLTVLARDIRILSALLNATDYYWWPSTPRVVESTDNRSFSHISTLLGIDTDMPVAVTGAITAENVTATIVCSRRGEPEQQLKLVESRSVGPSRRSLREILVDKKTPPGLEGYVADLIALFAAVRSKTISRTTIIEWIIYRGWSKLNTWMKRSETDFQGDLFDLVEAWSPDHDDDIPQRVVLMPNSSSVYDKYESIAIRTDDGGTTFVLNEDTASLLVKTIARIFRDIRQIIANPEVDRSQAAFSLVDSFVWLQVVLANKHVEILMTGTSLRFALVPKWPERNGYEHTDGWEPLPGRNCLRDNCYGLSYLRMLVACAASVFHLADPKILPLFAATNATIVSLVAPAHDAESERRSVVQAIVDEIERDAPVDARWPKAASKWIWWRADMAASGGGQEASCHLHTEAGLMALACKARLTCDGAHGSDEDRSVFLDLTRTPIGISGKSCPLCLRLAQLLNAHFSSLGNSEAFVFPHLKTHGKVLPWDPPQFGIPKSVLTQLRDELRRNLVEKAIAVANPPVPEVDTSDEDEHDEDILAIHDKISLPDGFEW